MSDNKIIASLKKVHWSVWLGLIIVFAVVRLCVIFSYRDGHHVDETWSYGYANSYYLPHVFGGYSEETEQNIGEWITGQVFKDYITVREDQRFSFDSVMFNKKDDLSPVLYAFILHFVCSFFPGQFSWGFAFFISVLFFIPSLVLIFVLTKEITDSKICGYISVIYYMFSGCGTANFLYMRVYHIFTFLTLLLFFLIHRIITNEGKKMWVYYLLLPVATLLGCLTHYYFLVMAFGLTLFGALVILCKKRLKDAFAVCVIMLLSVITFFLIYTPALAKLLPYSSGETGGTGYYHYPYSFDVAIANIHFFQGTIGWFIQFSYAGLLYFLGVALFVVIVAALMLFLFRNEQWMKSLIGKLKCFTVSSIKNVRLFCSGFNVSIVVSMLASVFYLLVIPYSATLVNMGFSERYFFPAMSLFLIAYMPFVFILLKRIYLSINKKVISVLFAVASVLLLVFLNIRTGMFVDVFRFEKWNDNEIRNEIAVKDVYLVINANRDLIYFSPIICDSNNVFVDYQSSFDKDDFTVTEIDKDCLVMIVEEGLLTEEQKQEMIESNTFSVEGLMKPDAFKTIDELIGTIETDNGRSYEMVDRYLTFLGYVSIYQSV